MKSIIKIAMLFALVASAVFAVPVVTMGLFTNSTSGNYTATPNGDLSFVLSGYAAGAATSTSFGTFCLEKHEFFTIGTPYNVTLANSADAGGVGGPYDRLSVGTSWLYSEFAKGTLSGYVYGNAGLASEFQQAIWSLEGEDYLTNMNSYFNGLLTGKFGSPAAAQADATPGQYGVYAMNLFDDNGGKHQDQLVYVAGPEKNDVSDTGLSTLFMFAGVLGIMATRVRFV